MARIDDDVLSLHLEIALSSAAPALLGGLADTDRRRRHIAVADMARHLVERLRCFEIQPEEAIRHVIAHPSLFPEDLGPIAR